MINTEGYNTHPIYPDYFFALQNHILATEPMNEHLYAYLDYASSALHLNQDRRLQDYLDQRLRAFSSSVLCW